MLRVDIASAKPGMTLAVPVTHARYPTRVLLRAGFVLNEAAIARLAELNHRTIWVAYPSLTAIMSFVNTDAMRTQAHLSEQITETFEKVQRNSSAKLPYAEYCRSVAKLIDDLVSHPKAAIFLDELSSSGHDDIMRHSSTVTYLSVLMGLKLEGYLVRQRKHVDPARAKEVTNLGIGAMLHDVGVMKLDRAVYERYMKTGDESDPEWRKHTVIGYDMVKGHVEPTAANTVLNHHQRMDGSGYGGRDGEALEGARIHVFSRIVGLAEQFDRLRCPPNLPPQPTVWALGALLSENMLAKFDPQVLAALFSVAPPYPPGSMVTLSNKQRAVVIDHHVADPCRPIVQLLEGNNDLDGSDLPLSAPIDLTCEPDLRIIEAEGHDVSELNFPPPAFLVHQLQGAA